MVIAPIDRLRKEAKMIRDAVSSDAGQIAEIYNHYIKNTTVTFETRELDEAEMAARIEKVLKSHAWIVMENGKGKITGYAYYTSFKPRAAFGKSVEATVYLDKDKAGRGHGGRLYAELIARFNKSSYHAMVGGIALPNEASVKLHEKYGFVKVAEFREVGYKLGKWIDVGYWELLKTE